MAKKAGGGRIRPLVSVVIPTYNRKEMLKDCLDSLFKQTFQKDRYEIIVVNDGSTDGTEEVLREHGKKATCKFRWFTQENRGPAAARNLGIEKAEGDIVCFIDDDCIADRHWIENLVRQFTDERVGGVGGEIYSYNPKTLVEKYGFTVTQRGASKVALMTANAAYRRDILRKIGGFDTKLKGSEDIDLGIRVKMEGYKLGFTPDAIVFHRHYNTIKSLMRRKYREGLHLACLSKKYVQHFNFEYYAPLFLLRALKIFVTLPFKLLFSKNNKSDLFKDIFSVINLIFTFFGFVRGIFSEGYSGDKITEKIEFLGDESFISLLKRKIKT